jgi:hypothetical protein
LSVVEIASGSWQAVRHPRLPRWCGGQHVPVGHPRRWAGQRLSTFGNVVFVWPALIVRLIGMGIVAAGCWYVLYRGVESVVTTLL